ncbi:MAG: protein kinase [Deltaproteobacteria bacterium]|jgi:serine/threonine protein kinase|nr:protein kinase [Deltaproteobacteria bacterium]
MARDNNPDNPDKNQSPVTVLELDSSDVVALTQHQEMPAPYQQPEERVITSFRGNPVERFPSSGAEADIYIVKTPQERQILKLYRQGLNPKEDVLKKISEVSRRLPKHVVRLFDSGFDQETNSWFELMEFVENGSLATWIGRGQARDFDFKTLVSQLTEAVDALQVADMVHRDLKPSNVLVRSVKPLELILADFGITNVMHNVSLRATERNFTPEYAPPEMDLASKAGDWWSLGIIFYEVLTGTIPFLNMSFEEILDALTRPVEIPTELDERSQQLLKGLLTRDIEHRWRASQIRQWLLGHDPMVFYDVEVASFKKGDGRQPFEFLGREFHELGDLALAITMSDANWQAGAKLLARGTLSEMLRKRGDTLDETRIEALACGDSNEYVFRFVHTYLSDREPMYRGRPLTGESLYIASQIPSANPRSAEGDFVQRTLNRGWDSLVTFLFEVSHPKLQPLFLSIIFYIQKYKIEKKEIDANTLKDILYAAFNRKLFYWGNLPRQDSKLVYQIKKSNLNYHVFWPIKYAIDVKGRLLSTRDYNALGGEKIVLTQTIAKQLSHIETYSSGIKQLRDRKTAGMLLLAEDIPGTSFAVSNGNKVYSRSDRDYDEIIRVNFWKFTKENLEVLNSTKDNLELFIISGKLVNESKILLYYVDKLLNGTIRIQDPDIEQFSSVKDYMNGLTLFMHKLKDIIIIPAFLLVIIAAVSFYFSPRYSFKLSGVGFIFSVLSAAKIGAMFYLMKIKNKLADSVRYVELRVKVPK